MQAQLPVEVERLEQKLSRDPRHHVWRRFYERIRHISVSQEYLRIDFASHVRARRMTKWMDGKLSLQSFFQADLGYTHNKVDNNNTFSAFGQLEPWSAL